LIKLSSSSSLRSFAMGNIVNSALYSGYFGVVFNRMYSLTRGLIPLLTGVHESVHYMRKVLAEKGKEAPDETLVVLLVQSKFSGLPQTVRDIMQVFAEMGDKALPDGWTDYKRHLAGWTRFPLERSCLTMEAVYALLEAGKAVCSSVEQMQEQGGMIEINQCHGSTIKSNGDIRINQEGAVQSRLFAKDRILFLHEEAVCRGGELEAGSSVQLQSVGGRIGAETVIRAQRRITARRMDLVKVILGPWEEHIDHPLRNVTIFSEKGRMRITGVRLNHT
jgi:hypothetical protein